MSIQLNKAISTYAKTVEWISQKFSVIGVIMLAGLMLLTVSDVALRFFFKAPIIGSLEVTELLMIVIVYPGVAWVAVKGVNVKVDLVVDRFPTRTQGIFDSVTCFLSLIVAALIGGYNIYEAFYMWDRLIATDILEIIHFPFFFLIAFAFFLLCLVLISKLIESVKKAVTG